MGKGIIVINLKNVIEKAEKSCGLTWVFDATVQQLILCKIDYKSDQLANSVSEKTL